MLALLERAHEAAADSRVRSWLSDAEGHLSRGVVTQAELLVEQARQLRPELEEIRRLESAIVQRRRDQERSRQLKSAIVRARSGLRERAFDVALQAAKDALAVDPDSAEASELERGHERNRGATHAGTP